MNQKPLLNTAVVAQGVILAAIIWCGSTLLSLKEATLIQGARLEGVVIQMSAVKESIVLAAADRYTKTMADKDRQMVMHRVAEVEKDIDSLKKWAKNVISETHR